MKHKPIRIDWDDLEGAFSNQNEDLIYYLDLVTGHVVLEGEGEGEADDFDDDDEHYPRATHQSTARTDATRAYVTPVTTEQKIEWIKVFATETADLEADFKSGIEKALAADEPAHEPAEALGALLRQFPEARDRWYLYRSECSQRLIETWLAEQNITPIEPPPWSA